MKNFVYLFLSMIFIFTSCSNKSEREIEDEISSGVVLVQNRSFYEIIFPDGESYYFSSFDEKGDVEGFCFDRDSVKTAVSYGTGFFISTEGEVATNAHVVSNSNDSDKKVTKSMRHVIDGLQSLIALAYYSKKEDLNAAQKAYDYANYSTSVSYADFYKVRDIRDALNKEVETYAKLYDYLDKVDPTALEVVYHNSVGIAYNDTHVTDESDFTSCVVTKTDTKHDLAILQLKDKITPAGKYIFGLPEEDALENYSLLDKVGSDKNSELYMASFNLGPTLAVTNEGIKSQFNKGAVSQKTSERLMYSIPALPGSSGSPVVNRKCELVAINYAGLNGTQNFNYGIRVKYLKRLVED